MIHYNDQEINEILARHNTNLTKGLTTEEANRRLERYGLNQLSPKSKRSFPQMFIARFKSFMIIFLLIAAAI
jgi:Ca2+-transporting ATPase